MVKKFQGNPPPKKNSKAINMKVYKRNMKLEVWSIGTDVRKRVLSYIPMIMHC